MSPLTLALLLPLLALDESAALEQRFRAEYPAALAAQEIAASQVTYRGRYLLRYFDGTQVVSPRMTLARDGERVVLSREEFAQVDDKIRRSGAAGARVDFRSPGLHFELVRRPRESAYVLVRHGVAFEGDDGILQDELRLMTRPHVFPDAIDLIERMKSPDFQVVGFRSEQLDDETLVRMEYTSQWPGGLAFSGWADFDPSRNWVLRRFSSRQTINPKDPSDLRVSEMKVDYREVDPSHYLPTRIERTLHALKTDRRQRHLIEYDEIIVGPPDESLFRLSGYGLPDVPLRPVTASGPSLLGNGWFWGSLVAGGLSLAALVFSRSRRASASAGN